MIFNSDDIEALAQALQARYEFPRRGARACAYEALKRTQDGNMPEFFPLDPCRPIARQVADYVAMQNGAKARLTK